MFAPLHAFHVLLICEIFTQTFLQVIFCNRNFHWNITTKHKPTINIDYSNRSKCSMNEVSHVTCLHVNILIVQIFSLTSEVLR